MKPNRSILVCPECEKPLVGIGSRLERIHPLARMVKGWYGVTIFIWYVLMFFGLKLVFHLFGTGTSGFGGGYVLLALAMVPFVLNYFLLRIFPVYRITDCPYCGFHEKQKLGFSESGEF